jgi:AraC family transcriptional activator FtrA
MPHAEDDDGRHSGPPLPIGTRGTDRTAHGSDAAPLICLLAYDGLCTFEFGIGVEVFGLPRPEFERWYRFRTVAVEPGPLRAAGGVTVEADHDLALLKHASLILVPGWRGADAPVPDDLVAALRAAHANGARMASICSGTFVLAAAGLLDGRRATTHWRYLDQLRERFPDVVVEPDVLFVDEGDVLTSAGSAAGLDLCLHIVRRDFGTAHANAVARRLILPAQREGGQKQYVAAPVPRERGGRIAPLLDAMRAAMDEAWSLERMAREAGLSRRTMSRRFVEATGHTPLSWLTRARVARAAELLESGSGSLADIAAACGFGSQETFRREFHRLRGTTPSRHRRAFGQVAGSGAAAERRRDWPAARPCSEGAG